MKGIRMKYKLYQKNSFSIIKYLILLLSPLIIIILIKFDKVFYEWQLLSLDDIYRPGERERSPD